MASFDEVLSRYRAAVLEVAKIEMEMRSFVEEKPSGVESASAPLHQRRRRGPKPGRHLPPPVPIMSGTNGTTTTPHSPPEPLPPVATSDESTRIRIRRILESAGRPMSRADLYESLVQGGSTIKQESLAGILANAVERGEIERLGFGSYAAKK